RLGPHAAATHGATPLAVGRCRLDLCPLALARSPLPRHAPSPPGVLVGGRMQTGLPGGAGYRRAQRVGRLVELVDGRGEPVRKFLECPSDARRKLSDRVGVALSDVPANAVIDTTHARLPGEVR